MGDEDMNISQEILVLDFGDDDQKLSKQPHRQAAALPSNFPANSMSILLFILKIAIKINEILNFRHLFGSRRDSDHLQRNSLSDQDVRAGFGRHLRSPTIDVHLYCFLLFNAPLDRIQ